MTTCAALDGRREHVLDVDVGDGLAGRHGDLAADRAHRGSRSAAAARGSGRAHAAGSRARGRGRRRRSRAPAAGGGASPAAARVDGGVPMFLSALGQQRGALPIELGRLGDRRAQRLDLRLQLANLAPQLSRRDVRRPARRVAGARSSTANPAISRRSCLVLVPHGFLRLFVVTLTIRTRTRARRAGHRGTRPGAQQPRALDWWWWGTSQATRAAVAAVARAGDAHQVAAAPAEICSVPSDSRLAGVNASSRLGLSCCSRRRVSPMKTRARHAQRLARRSRAGCVPATAL